MRKSPYTILIICEGKNTEPHIFNSLRDEIINGTFDIGDVKISIRPEPIIEEDEEQQSSPHKAQRIKIKTRSATVGAEPLETSAPLPLKWVLEGQRELEDNTYNEVWAVFDHDNFPAREKAFEESKKEINGKKVRIAFSSICFEYYLLLHFEQLYKAFDKSECRYKNDKGKSKLINCNSGTHEKDCFGNNCTGGYARKKEYWNSSKDRESLYPIIKDKLEVGFENSAWLRYISDSKESEIPFYNRNPYITTDNIIKRLVGKDDINWIWIKLNQEYSFNNIKVFIYDDLQLQIQNISKQTILVSKDSFSIISQDNNRQKFGDKFVLEPNQRHNFKIEQNNNDQNHFFMFCYENNRIMFQNSLIKNTGLNKIVSSLFSLTYKELTNLIELLKK